MRPFFFVPIVLNDTGPVRPFSCAHKSGLKQNKLAHLDVIKQMCVAVGMPRLQGVAQMKDEQREYEQDKEKCGVEQAGAELLF